MKISSSILVLFGLVFALDRDVTADSGAGAGPGTGALDGVWRHSATRAVAETEYHASMNSAGLQAPNRAQNLRTHFGDSEIAITSRDAGQSGEEWSFAWCLTRWGRPGRLEVVASAAPSARGARVTYSRPELSEWYENTPQGVEQGFDVFVQPAGEGPLCLEGIVQSNLLAVQGEEDAIDFLNAQGDCVFRYAKLLVLDAAGRELPANLWLENGTLTIWVDDEGARYPLFVDPLMTSPAWTVESNQSEAELGASVATAGDVNGDGYSDVIVGAPRYDNGESDEGRVFLYLGSANGLELTPSWTAESNNLSSDFGGAVASAGDVNRDGFADVVVGAQQWRNDDGEVGRAFVYLGSPSGLASDPVWEVSPTQANSRFGVSVGTAGDVNGDGYADVIVGAMFYDNDQMGEGRVFVYRGTSSGVQRTPFWIAESNQAGSWYGSTVGTAGDVNGDGFSDVIVGANDYDNGQTGEGRAFVYFGSESALASVPSWTGESNQAASHYAVSVGTAGDVNGDGYADVIVGAAQYANGQSLEGRAYVYHGSATGPSLAPSWTTESNQVGAHLGTSVATAGDINGDGYSEVIIGIDEYDNGQNAEGRAIVHFGGNGGLETAFDWAVESDQADAALGRVVATAGDVNGDGFSDVIVSAPWFDNGENLEGKAFVYHGSAGSTDTHYALNMTINQSSMNGGTSVALAGDVNGDGYSDYVIGGPLFDNGQDDEGGAFVYFGEREDSSEATILESNQIGAHFGTSVAGAGDVNGDGYSDVIVGAPDYDNGQTNEGRIYVFLGSSAGVATTPSWTAESNQAGAGFGWSVASAGDVNGDGYSDVIAGAYQFNNGQEDEGRAVVYLGSATGLGSSPAWTVESNQAIASFGISVASAGDVDGDGFSDVLVGANLYDNGQSNEGRAFLYRGSASGLATSPAWTAESNQSASNFGISVASAGDLDGDGFSDVIVGADSYDNGEGDEGRAYVYIGSETGLGSSPAWILERNQTAAQFGISVASAGDVNADGFGDVVVGAIFWDQTFVDEGAAFVYHGSASGLVGNPPIGSGQAFSWYGNSVSGAGDVNGDGFSDLLVGAPAYDTPSHLDNGISYVYYGNGRGSSIIDRDRIVRQARSNDSAPIALLGRAADQNAFMLKAKGRTAAGRGKVWLEWEVKELGEAFDQADRRQGPALDTGAPLPVIGSSVPLKDVIGLEGNTAYHWRVRIASSSPFFPWTPWISMPGNSATEADLRTRGTPVGVEDPEPVAKLPFVLERIHPNPFAAPYEISYSLAGSSRVRLAVYDVQGRVRALIAEGQKDRGRHVVTWAPRGHDGRTLASGVYFVRLSVGDRVETQKLILAP